MYVNLAEARKYLLIRQRLKQNICDFMNYEQEINFEKETKKKRDEAEYIAKEMQTNNFAIISACNKNMSKEEANKATYSLISDFEKETDEKYLLDFDENKSKKYLLITMIHGHYKYSDGTLADEKSVFFSSKYLSKEFVEKIAKKYNQESYIYNMVLYDTKTGEIIIKFNKIIIKDTKFFEDNNEENYSTIDSLPAVSFKFE
jgi:hypothetical protein